MALLVWLPLRGDLKNLGLSNITVTNNGATVNNEGKIGKCYSFDGSDDYLYTSNYTNLGNNFSVTCWVYFNIISTGCILCTRSATYGGLFIYLNSGNMEIDPTASSFSNGVSRWTTTFSPQTKTWYHLVITRTPTEISYYINGELQLTKTVTYGDNYGNTLTIGCRSTNGGSRGVFLNGKLNDIRIYDHCLSPKEVKEISKGLVLHYKLNEGNYSNNFFPYGVELYDYILNDGLAYIDTGYYPNQSSKIIYKERHFETGSTSFGELEGSIAAGRNTFFVSLTQFGFDRIVFDGGITRDTNVHTVELSVNGLYKNDTLIALPKSDIAATWTSPRKMYLFALNRGSSISITNYVLYYLQIWENDTLVRDYKPCLYNGEAGLWDTVENKFYGNSGSGEFTLGNKIVFYDYINNDGNQDLDTGLIYNSENNNYKIECKFNMSGNVGNYDAVFSAYESENHKTMRIIRMNNDSRFGYYFNTKANSTQAVTTTPNSDIYEVIMTSQLITVHNTTLEITEYLTPIYTTATASTTETFHLFPKSKVNIWYWRIYDGETLLRNMIPCEYNDEPGMWDTVTHLFYGNSGTGQFFVRAYHNFDTSGYLNNGSFANNINYLENSPRYDKYAAMNARNYINFTNNFLNLSLPFTICFWCYFANNTSSVIPLVINDLNHGRSCNFGINTLSVNLFGLFTTTQFQGVLQGTPKIGWAHYALVYDGSIVKIYRDGALLYNLNKTFSYASSVTSSSGYICKTPMSDLRIYTTILSEEDIKELYNTSAVVDNLGNDYCYLFEESMENIELNPPLDSFNHTSGVSLFDGKDLVFTGTGSSYSNFIEVDTSKTLTYDITFSNQEGSWFLIGFERYDENKATVSNSGCIYVIDSKNTVDHKRISGVLTLSDVNGNPCKFTKIRVLNCWGPLSTITGGIGKIHSFHFTQSSGSGDLGVTKLGLIKSGWFIEDETLQSLVSKNKYITANQLIEI